MAKQKSTVDKTQRIRSLFVAFLLLGSVLPAMFLAVLPEAGGDSVDIDDDGNIVIDGSLIVIDQDTNKTGEPGIYNMQGNITIKNGGELRVINATLRFLPDMGPDLKFGTGDDRAYWIHVENGGFLNMTNSNIVVARDILFPLQHINISMDGGNFFAANCSINQISSLVMENSSVLETAHSEFYFFNLPEPDAGDQLPVNDTLRIVDSTMFLNNTELLGEDEPILKYDHDGDLILDEHYKLYLHLYKFPGAPTFRAKNSDIVLADSNIGREGSEIGSRYSINRPVPDPVICRPLSKNASDDTGSDVGYLDGPDMIMMGYNVPYDDTMHIDLFENVPDFEESFVTLVFSYELFERNSTAENAIEWSSDGGASFNNIFPPYTPESEASDPPKEVRMFLGSFTPEEVSSIHIRYTNDHGPVDADFNHLTMWYMYLEVTLSLNLDDDWRGWEHVYFDGCDVDIINSYIDSDFYGDDACGPLSQEHVPIVFTNSTTARLLNLRVRDRKLHHPEWPVFNFKDSASNAYIYRWGNVHVLDNIGQLVPNATVSFSNSSFLSPINLNTFNFQNNMLEPEQQHMLEYIKRVYAVDETDYLITSDSNNPLMIPLLSDICSLKYAPGSYSEVSNYRFYVGFQNYTGDWFNTTVNASFSTFPNLTEEDNIKDVTARLPVQLPSPDLAISHTDIVFDPPYPVYGDDVTITATIHNVGDAAAPSSVLVSFYNQTSGRPLWLLENVTTTDAIPPEGSITVSTIITAIDWSHGRHVVSVHVDPEDAVPETSTDNNVASADLFVNASVDIYPMSVSAVPTAPLLGEPVTIIANIMNNGLQDVTTPFHVYFYDNEDNNLLGMTTVSDISAGTDIEASIVWTTERLGIHNIRVDVDPENIVKEYDIENNIAVFNDVFAVNPKSDLTITSIRFSNPYPAVGDEITIDATVKNIGAGDAGTFWLRVWDDSNGDGMWSVAEAIGYDSVNTLNADDSTTRSFVWTVESPRGVHNIYAEANHNMTINEADYTNNVHFSPLFVVNVDRDIIVNATLPLASPGVLDIDNVEMEHHGFVLVGDQGVLTLTDSSFSVQQDSNYEYFIVVRENGTLNIESSTLSSNYRLSIILYDNSTLTIAASTLGANIDIESRGVSNIWFQNVDPRADIDITESSIGGFIRSMPGVSTDLTMTNTTVTNHITEFGGESVGTLTSVKRLGLLPGLSPSEDAYFTVWWWLTVTVRDEEGKVLMGAEVDVYDNNPPPPEHYATGSTNAQGIYVIPLLSRTVAAAGTIKTTSYLADAEHGGYNSLTRSVTMDGDKNLDLTVLYTAPPSLPDIYVESVTILRNNDLVTEVYNMTSVTVRVVVQNIGSADSGTYTLRILRDDEVVHTSTQPGIPADNMPYMIDIPWQAMPVGEYDIIANVSGITETDYTNNEASTPLEILARPNIVLVSISTSPSVVFAGGVATISALVSNEGGEDAGEFSVLFKVDGVELGSVTVDGLASGTDIIVPCLDDWNPTVGGYYTITAHANHDGVVLETNYDDNILSKQMLVYTHGLDIVVEGTETVYINNTSFTHSGHVLVKDSGTLVLHNTNFFVAESGKTIIVEDSGTLILSGSSVLRASYSIAVELKDDSTLWLEASTINPTAPQNVNIVMKDSSTLFSKDSSILGAGRVQTSYSGPGARIHMYNTTLTNPFILDGAVVAHITNPLPGTLTMSVREDSTASLYLYYWLTVDARDGNNKPMPGVDVYVRRTPFPTVLYTNTTGEDGTHVFQALSREYYPGGSIFRGNYNLNGSYIFGTTTYMSDVVSVDLTTNRRAELHFPDALPDLDPVITVEHPQLNRGDTTWINVSGIKNVGVVTAHDVLIRVIDHNYSETRNGVPEDRIIYEENLGNIEPFGTTGDERYILFYWTATYNLGMHNISATLDPDNTMYEFNKDNNTVYTEIDVTSLPDLTVSDIDLPAQVTRGQSAHIEATIENIGDWDTEEYGIFTVTFSYIFGADDPVVIDTRNITSLAPLTGTATRSIEWRVDSTLAPGTYTIHVEVDAEGNVPELRYDNNVLERTIHVARMSDLSISDIDFPGTETEAGMPLVYTHKLLNITVTARNTGQTPVSDALLEIYIGSELQNSTTIAIDVGEYKTHTFHWSPVLPEGVLVEDYEFTARISYSPQEPPGTHQLVSDTVRVRTHLPDFLIHNVTLYTSDGQEVNESTSLTEGMRGHANITIENRGVPHEHILYNTIVEMWLGEPGNGTMLSYANVSLPIGAHEIFTIDFILRIAEERDVEEPVLFTFIVNPEPEEPVDPEEESEERVPEVRYDNNVVTMELWINPPPAHIRISVEESTLPAGQATIRVGVTIVPAGDEPVHIHGLEQIAIAIWRGETVYSMETYTLSELRTFIGGRNDIPGDGLTINIPVSAPSTPGEYTITVSMMFYGEEYHGISSAYIVVESAEEETGIPGWMFALIAILIMAPIIAISLYLYKYGLGTLVECGECNALIPIGSSKCPKCGVGFEADTAKCSVCGSWLSINSKSCQDCGAEFVAVEESTEDYEGKMMDQYHAMIAPYKMKASEELGIPVEEMTKEQFNDWWAARPEYVSSEDWMTLEEEKKAAIKPMMCPECNSLNPSGSRICYKCGVVLEKKQDIPVEKEEKAESPKPPATPPPTQQSSPDVAKKPAPPAAEPKQAAPSVPAQEGQKVARKVVTRPPTEAKRVVVQRPAQGQVVARKVVTRPKSEEEEKKD